MTPGRDIGIAASSDAAEHLRLLVESQPDYAIFLLDPSGHVMSWNGGARRLKGYEADEIIGQHFSVFYPRDQVEPASRPGSSSRRRSNGRHEAEGWRVRKDGTRFWADVVITALRDEQGTLVGFGKVTRDLTSRQLASEQLRSAAAELRVANAELEQFRLLITSVRDYAIFVLDVSGPHPDVEHRRGEHQGLHGRGGDRPALRALLHRGGARSQASRVRAGGRGARRPLRGGRLARAQGRHAVLGQRRDHRAARPAAAGWSASPRSRAT